MAAYLYRAIATPTSTKIFTFSTWVKSHSDASTDTGVVCAALIGNSSYRFNIQFGAGFIQIGGSDIDVTTARKFRDPSAWWNIVVAVDTSQGTDTNRCKLYVNGEAVTLTGTFPTQDSTTTFCDSAASIYIGQGTNAGAVLSKPFNGLQAHTHFIDGTAYTPTAFGETDATSGIWKPKTSPSVTYGNNGFFLKYASGAHGTDSSGNGNDYTISGTLTNTKDTPQNNFCTWNPMDVAHDQTYTFENGNTVCLIPSASGWRGCNGTLGAAAGKWYMEGYINYTPGAYNTTFGFTSGLRAAQKGTMGQIGYADKGAQPEYGVSFGIYDTGTLLYSTTSANNQQTASWCTPWAAGDYLMFAIDIDGGKFYFGANGTWDTTNSNDPAAGTGGYTFTKGTLGGPEFFFPTTTVYQEQLDMNFGNGYFATTVAGTNADANDEGAFKYTPPTGFYALCTNNLKLYGAP